MDKRLTVYQGNKFTNMLQAYAKQSINIKGAFKDLPDKPYVHVTVIEKIAVFYVWDSRIILAIQSFRGGAAYQDYGMAIYHAKSNSEVAVDNYANLVVNKKTFDADKAFRELQKSGYNLEEIKDIRHRLGLDKHGESTKSEKLESIARACVDAFTYRGYGGFYYKITVINENLVEIISAVNGWPAYNAFKNIPEIVNKQILFTRGADSNDNGNDMNHYTVTWNKDYKGPKHL